LVYDSLSAGFYKLIFIFKHLRQERNRIVENDEEAFTHNLEQVLDNQKSGFTSAGRFGSSSVFDEHLVELLPSLVILDSLAHGEYQSSQIFLDEILKVDGWHVGVNSCQFADGGRE
jgi:hypothetical protein